MWWTPPRIRGCSSAPRKFSDLALGFYMLATYIHTTNMKNTYEKLYFTLHKKLIIFCPCYLCLMMQSNKNFHFQSLSCFDCGCPGPNLWICLQPDCHHVGCSEVNNDHSTIHQKVTVMYVYNNVAKSGNGKKYLQNWKILLFLLTLFFSGLL